MGKIQRKKAPAAKKKKKEKGDFVGSKY